MFVASIIIVFLTIIIIPEEAFAWGPATHLELAQTLLGKLSHISHPVRLLIERYPHDFLYGNIIADIVVGKNLAAELKHCHNWKFGFKLLRRASTEPQRAFAYGYMAHLAADTVAHNHYIPEMMIRSFSARTTRHIYWETRFDLLADKTVWLAPKKMVRFMHTDNDRLLGSLLEDVAFSYRTNKTIFSGILSINRINQWHKMLRLIAANSRWPFEKKDRERFLSASMEAMVELLNNSYRAPCVKKDPTGRHFLNGSKLIRKKLKLTKKLGRNWQDALESALKWVRI